MNCMMDCMMCSPCCATTETGGMQSPLLAKAMQPVMRYMMNTLMKITEDHSNDITYAEVQTFMVPEMVGKEFKDKPGTFSKTMEPRLQETGMAMCGVRIMLMDRTGMKAAGPPHNKGITWEKFAEHRGYAVPPYMPKHPKNGEIAPDGKILSIDGAPSSTLLTEARKLAKAAGTDKVVLCFDGVTCPFFRAYAAEDMYNVLNGVPMLHVYIREAEPSDVFDAGGMHNVTPLKMKTPVTWHKSEAERAEVAKDTKIFLESFVGKGKVTMWMDTMDDNLEKVYEARPWRWYVIEASTGKVITATGLAPFNMDGKLAKLKAACEGISKDPKAMM